MRRLYPTWTLDQWYWDGGVIVDMLEYAGIVFLGIILTLFFICLTAIIDWNRSIRKICPHFINRKNRGIYPNHFERKKILISCGDQSNNETQLAEVDMHDNFFYVI